MVLRRSVAPSCCTLPSAYHLCPTVLHCVFTTPQRALLYTPLPSLYFGGKRRIYRHHFPQVADGSSPHRHSNLFFSIITIDNDLSWWTLHPTHLPAPHIHPRHFTAHRPGPHTYHPSSTFWTGDMLARTHLRSHLLTFLYYS